ncbi:flagellar biosynthesis protein FlhF [Psychrobium sp. 1_MG-2023]|uniref:flagellar biosynthesis protein FlhF n=1 Tax=Psychrobium sp. 1_MG-2023 TaxID=3062624 RepID=UPI000C3369F4|nr:flagellar biosynthesis protein FlhF [Psychrobium sp. 1_MG-2023]MDP2559823.1 flagellar biosynthesis protein FlhF [Psychrobium sp. 1_MG-2023]PKF59073.1 flagellar biosynthesis protein FlhF [Alteromonadales bacterium alter-6D02]
MKIKRFVAKDIRSALDEIKIALGPDAIIMSNKKVDGGVEIVAAVDEDNNAVLPKASPKPASSQTVAAPSEVMADRFEQAEQPVANFSAQAQAQIAMQQYGAGNSQSNNSRQPSDDQLSLSGFQQRLIKQQAQQIANNQMPINAMSGQGASSADNQPTEPVTATLPNTVADNLPEWAQALQKPASISPQTATSQAYEREPAIQQENPAIEELRAEMASMRQLLQHQVSGLMEQDVNRRDPLRAMLTAELCDMGFEADVAQQLVVDVRPDATFEQAKQIIASTLLKRISTTNNDVLEQGGVVALLGPTGVGKTTTVAKLAARFAMQYGSDQIAMITTDSYRIGAYEQLNTYGKILGCPVKVAKDAQQLADAIYQCRQKRLVLIDTAGMGQRDLRLSEQLATLMNSSHVNIRSYLVLPATAQRKVLQEAIIQFRKMPLAGCIITKMDEAIGASEILSVAIGHSLPIGYLTNGQRVPEDIGVADLNSLINNVIEQLSQVQDKMTANNDSSSFSSFNR